MPNINSSFIASIGGNKVENAQRRIKSGQWLRLEMRTTISNMDESLTDPVADVTLV